MRAFPFIARLFIVLVCILGLAATAATFLLPAIPGDKMPPYGIALAIFLAGAAGMRHVELIRSSRYSEAGSMSLGYVITFAALFAFGVRAGVLIGIVTGLSAGLYPSRQPLHQLLFNVAAIAATAWASGQTFALFNGGISEQITTSSIGPAFLAALIYFLLNTGCVATIVALCVDGDAGRIGLLWRQNYLWTAPGYFAAASCGLLGQLLFQSNVSGLLLAIPLLVFVYQSYKVYTEKEDQKRRYIKELETGRQMLADLYISTVKSLAIAIDSKDSSTHAHIQRVQRYAVAIAEKMNVGTMELEAVRTGALLHDIGKLGVPDYVLLKPGPLSDDEFDKMKRHTLVGAAILEPVHFPWPVLNAVRYHHERWDGTGYPEGLAGENIPIEARIMAVADVYDALTSDRPYRAAWPQERALDYLQTESGTQFDPGVVNAFLEIAEAVGEADALEKASAEHEAKEGGYVTSYIRRTGTELWALYEIAQTLNSDLDMTNRLEALSRKITTVLPGTTCALLLHDPRTDNEDSEQQTPDISTERLWVWAAAGANSDALRRAYTQGEDSLSLHVIQSGQSHRGEGSENDLILAAPHKMSAPLRSALIVPLTHLGEKLGTLNLYHPAVDAFAEDDEHLLTMIAGQVQSALYHDMLFDRTRNAALTDPLTGLYNVRYLTQAIKPSLRAVSGAEQKTPYAVLYLDLDNFKTVNDTFGHQKGDMVLRDVAGLLRHELRPGDLLVRYGGDEFLVILPQTTEESASQVAARIRKAVAESSTGLILSNGEELRMGASIGVACYPEDDLEIESLVTIADNRMYEEKIARNHDTLPHPSDNPDNGKRNRSRAAKQEHFSAPVAQAVVQNSDTTALVSQETP